MKLNRSLFITFAFIFSVSVYAGDISEKLGNIFTFQNPASTDEILDPEIAFRVSVDAYSNNQLILNWDIEPGYYLYKNKFTVEPVSTDISFGDMVFPKGKVKDDPAFGQVEVYYGQDSVSTSFVRSDINQTSFDLAVAYQGCKEDTVCYPPIKKILSVAVNPYASPEVTSNDSSISTPLISEQDSITQKLKNKSLLFNILSFFGFGFLLALTPCVFPMIPILSGIIVGQGEQITRIKAITLSVSYVVAMALTYAVLGVIAGLFSINLQAASQNPWALTLFSGVFVLLALSMFGFYELQLPSSWQAKLSSASATSGHGTLKGAAIMGVLSAIIVGPCVAPPLAGALLYISQTGNASLGGLALFAMGLGLGVPLLIVGATSGELLPRAGVWMETIKRIFGVIMLGVAIWFLERVLPASVVLLLWAILFITTAIFIGALDRIEAVTTHWQRLWKGFGLAMLVYGVVLIVAAAIGGGTVLKPFKQQTFSSATANENLTFNYVSSLAELDYELHKAKLDGQAVMLDFYADWCVVCIELETYTFPDPSVQTMLQRVKLLKADVTNNNEADKILLKHFGLFGPPAILFFNAEAKEVKSHRLIGFIKAGPFVEHVRQAIDL